MALKLFVNVKIKIYVKKKKKQMKTHKTTYKILCK